ncbi:MAG: amino acid adenylation domain-containing protein [Acidobacteriota bacterium]|nr:amino acid adenylation domain-containing protein [Acidobacteriota bacterium]
MTDQHVEHDTDGEDLDQIAIVGLNARFPHSPDVNAFWENLRNGVEMTDEPTEKDLDRAGVSQEMRNRPEFIRVGGFIEDTAYFDANFFGLTPRDAAILDPQHRFFLEMCWHALEHAGYDPETGGKRLGLFAGCGNNYYIRHVFSDPDLVEGVDPLQVSIGNSVDHLAPRVSYMLNLRGPSVPVQTACSTSLVAVHLACQSLIAYESDMAMAGGVRLSIPIRDGYLYVPDSIFSPDGHCHAFDHRAQGCIPGNGAGVVVLKRLEDAIEDGDHIHAVIRASAVNNDGSFKLGYTAPSVEGQRRVIKEALSMAALEGRDISMIEAHGTGTSLGDPIEFDALNQAFDTDEQGFCALGSVKSNMGHTDAAAGIAGLIKAVLCLEHKTLVPSLNYEQPNPQIDLENSPFYVNTETRTWENARRFAGVSSFGIGGTNAHIILAQAPEPEERAPDTRPVLPATISAKTEKALLQRCDDLVAWLNANPDADPADVAFTLNAGRQAMAWRRALAFTDTADLTAKLSRRGENFKVPASQPKLVFLFPGQGTDYDDLGGELYRTETTFRETVDTCCELLKPRLGLNLADLMYGDDPRLREPQFWQPALFVTSYAMAKTYMSWGLYPESMTGHSVGEYVAAVLSGIFSLEDGLHLIAERGKGTAALEGGAMLAVVAEEDKVTPHLGSQLSLAAKNGPQLCVVSGPNEQVDALAEKLTASGIRTKRLTATHAFHSAMVEPLMPKLTQLAEGFQLDTPQIPLISNVTGNWFSTQDATDAGYWARHLRGTVRFNEGLETLMDRPGRVFLEVGPGKVLGNLARNHPANADGVFPCISLGKETGNRALIGALAALWRHGIDIDWKAWYKDEERRRLVLPLYPFDRHVHWFNEENVRKQNVAAAAPQAAAPSASLDERCDPAHWYYLPTWQSRPLMPMPDTDNQTWLIIMDRKGRLEPLAELLTGRNQTVICVRPGESYEAGDHFQVDPEQTRHLGRVAEAMRDRNQTPERIVYGPCMDITGNDPKQVRTYLNQTLDHQVQLVRTLNQVFGAEQLLVVDVITAGMYSVAGETTTNPVQALSLGPVSTAPREYTNQQWRCIDLPVTPAHDEARRLLPLLTADHNHPLTALRGNLRFIRNVEQLPPQSGTFAQPYREGGVYVLLNCWREIAMTLAQTLILEADASLVLVDRAFFPATEEERDAWLAEQGSEDTISERIEWVRALQDLGAELRIVQADPADVDALRATLQQAAEDLGPVHVAFLFDHPDSLVLIDERGPGFQATGAVASLGEALALCELDDCYERAVIFGEHPAQGALGKVEHRAVYAFLSALAEDSAAQGKPVTVIDWGTRTWRPVARKGLPQAALDYFTAERERFGMSHAECLEALARIMDMGLTRTIVSTRPYHALLEEQNLLTLEVLQQKITEAIAEAPVTGKPRPELDVPYEEPADDVQRTLVKIWQSFFGYSEIGIHDNFFDLGGHSLMATRVTSRIRDELGAELNLDSLFGSPTIAQLAELVRQYEQRDPELKLPPIEASGKTGPERLSFAQQRLWFLDRFVEGDASRAAYNIFAPNEINGDLDPLILERALGEVVRRQGSLRTTFTLLDDEPVQLIAPYRSFQLPVIDLRHMSPDDRERAAHEIIEQQVSTPFDLEKGPLYRFLLVLLRENHFHFHFTLQHTIGDGWSMGSLIGEMTGIYRAFSQGRPSPLPPLPVQYIDYTLWQRSWEHGPYMHRHLDYWKKQLEGAPAMLQLPADAPRTGTPSFEGARYQFRISPEITRKLEGLVKVSGATMFMVLESVMTALFRIYSGQDDIVLGSPIANRNYRETEPLIGFFVNTLVLRSQLHGNMTVMEHLDRTRRTALDGFAHQDVPFEYIVERIQPERNLTQSPLFQVMFALQNTPAQAEVTPELIIRPLTSDTVASIFDMTWNFHELGPEGLLCQIDYNVELYTEATLARLCRHYVLMADAMGSNPEKTLDSFDLLTGEERTRVLDLWNRTEVPIWPEAAHLRVGMKAAERPEHIAVVVEDAEGGVTELTYHRLWTDTCRIAAVLRARGIGPEDRVALWAERTPDLLPALLGIMSAGAAYLPLDPGLPAERLAYILQDSGTKLLLTPGREPQSFPETNIPRMDTGSIPAEEPGLEPGPVNMTGAAYVIYTSGTTGKPKGTVLHHIGLSNLVADIIRLYRMDKESRVLQFMAAGFDVSLLEFFTPLCVGGTLVLAPRESMMPGAGLAGLIERREINCATIPPSALIAEDAPLDVKTLAVIGEACPPELAARRGPETYFLNTYGPTETTITSTAAVCTGAERTPPIGNPLANNLTYVVSPAFRPVPVGVPGELVIGGIGLARGYLNRPALTAERFVPNPFTDRPGDRLYRTGDLVCHRGDETCVMEYIGRIDHQVKLRGFRIELAEIEVSLAALPNVARALVMVREDIPGDPRLTAYLIAQDEEPQADDMRNALAAHLPNYMIPNEFVIMESFPLNPNGKIDRKALPAPDRTRGSDNYVAPETPTQQQLAAMWMNVLGLEKVGLQDNFFALGGHSLLATKLVSRINDKFEIELDLRKLFTLRNLEDLADHLDDILTAADLQNLEIDDEEDREEMEI